VVFEERQVPAQPDVIAPDGSEVRILVAAPRGSCAHFTLAAGETSVAARHRTVEEIWYFVSGQGVMWRHDEERDAEIAVSAGIAITIPCGTHFQFRSDGPDPLIAVGVTMPPWPGEDEAVRVDGPWPATVAPGPGLDEPA
jgi:mannose-6-phosphate isomerase-like protein (cupin superfamily)